MSIQNHGQGSESISLSSHMGLDMPSLEPPMNSNENPPQLALSDIMHHMSPSPVPAEDSKAAEYPEMVGPYPNGNRKEREGSPEPLTEADVVAMRRRIYELGISLDRDRNGLNIVEGHSDDFGNATLRERELVNMVLRLTDPLPTDSTQLERQADVISVLTSQRDFLVRQAEEDRDRWRSEREGWNRMAEALLSHRNRTGKPAPREDEAERQKVKLESENRALRDKLQDTQHRLSSLESELMRLKPLLLMQPYSVTHLRQNLVPSQPRTSVQPPNSPQLTAGHGAPDVRPHKSMSDVKGKQREADSTSSRPQLEAIPEDIATNEERGLGPPLTRSSRSGSLTPSKNASLFSGASTSTADIYRRPEPLPQHSYPYNYHPPVPSVSPPKSTLIPPKSTVNLPSSSSTGAGSTSKSLGSTALQILPTAPSQSHQLSQTNTTTSPQRRRSRDYVNHPAGATHNAPIRRSNHGIAPLTSDARTEHVLLAARRIGRERAVLVAGIKEHAEREREIHARELELMKARQDLEKSEKERLERLANGTSGLAYYRSTDVLITPQRNTGRGSAPAGAPRTPKSVSGVGATHYPSLNGAMSNSPILSPARVLTPAGPSTFVFVNTSAGGTSGYSGGGALSTPGRTGSVLKSSTARGGSKNLPSNPPTPLDSLLDAARSMMDDGAGGKAGGKTNSTRKALEHSESPVPKRRRVSSGSSKTVGRGAGVAGASVGSKVARVRSALDVLADQAAAAFDEPGETRRGSNSGGKGKEKRKFGDEDLGNGGDRRVDEVQEDDDAGRQDDSWPQGSTPIKPSRGRSRAKATSINTRPIAEPTSSSSMSLRPVRQASQKRLASQDLQPPPSIPTATARGKGKARGRPKGSKSRPRSTVSVKSWSTSNMNPSVGPRVIASAPSHSPLEEAIALQSPQDKKRDEETEQEMEECSQSTPVNSDRSPGRGSVDPDLRPMTEWGGRGTKEGERDEGIQSGGGGEYVPSIVTGHELGLCQQDGYAEGKFDADGAIATESGNDKVTASAESTSTLKIIVQDMEEDVDTPVIKTTNGHVSPADVDTMTIPPVNDADTDADAEADLDDEDAEGDQEEDGENADAEAGQDRSSRSRTPPLPNPPHSGAPSHSNDDDPDADAEGEVDFEENEELPPT